MATDRQYHPLAADLAALGRSLKTPAPDAGLPAAVMARLAETPAPQTARRRPRIAGAVAGWRRRAAVVATAILLALLAAPPVRAAVADWFEFAGVSVRLDPTPSRSVASPPPAAEGTTTLVEAEELVTFEPLVPAALGSPQGVEVSADRRLLSLSWTDQKAGAVRLDQFDGRLDYAIAKTAPRVEFTTVAGSPAMWFDEPHEVVVINADGTRRTESARLAGRTLIWEYGGTTLRLEGDLTLARAIEIASSTTTLP